MHSVIVQQTSPATEVDGSTRVGAPAPGALWVENGPPAVMVSIMQVSRNLRGAAEGGVLLHSLECCWVLGASGAANSASTESRLGAWLIHQPAGSVQQGLTAAQGKSGNYVSRCACTSIAATT